MSPFASRLRRSRNPIRHGLLPAIVTATLVLGPSPGGPAARAGVVINEIHYHPANDCEEEEFVELHNPDADSADISGWHFLEGVPFEFPPGTVIEPGGYLVVARDPDALEAAFGPIDDLFGPWGVWPDGDPVQASLSNGGEDIVLADAGGVVVERVRYNDREPWSISPDGEGPSLERISPVLPGDKAGNWRAAGVQSGAWRFFESSGPAPGDQLRIFLDGPGTYLVDDLRIEEVSSGAEILGDGGFETPGAWSSVGNHAESGIVQGEAHTGDGSLEVVASGAGGPDNAVERLVEGLVADGPEYRISFWARTDSPLRHLVVQLVGGTVDFEVSEDIGAVAAPGSSSYTVGSETYTVSGSGADIWSTADEFRFVHTGLAGNGSIEGEVAWSGTPPNAWGKAGFMIRESVSPSSRHAMVLISRDHGVRLQYRTATGGSSSDITGPNVTGPLPLRLTRRGDQLIAEADTGGGFVEFGRTTIPMNTDVRIGMMVTSHQDGAIATAQFRGVRSSAAGLAVTTDRSKLQQATPGAPNGHLSDHVPPYIRKIEHTPREPGSSDPVVITAKVDSPDGLTPIVAVELDYQVVLAGHYVPLDDPAYSESWTTVQMRDDGTAGDALPDDLFWSARLPQQPHRSLVRYRLRALDATGAVTQFPYADDPSPNLAYFVYDGIPDYVADVRSAHGPTPVVHAAGDFGDLPVYHLITRREDLDECWLDSIPFSDKVSRKQFRWKGTFVYDGDVYDHIDYRLRGGVWRYSYRKRYMKIRFLRGHRFEGRDQFGHPHPHRRKKLNLNSGFSNPNAGNHVRGESGLFETLAFSLFRWTGIPSSTTTWVHFRTVADENERGANQYGGDFLGLYLDIEQLDSSYLETHDRPDDGNLYKIDTGALNGRWDKEVNSCDPADDSDIRAFVDTYQSSSPTESWWRSHLDLDEYYSYRSGIEMARHYDIGAGKNYYYYHNPDTDLWEVFPWDLDLTFNTNFSSVGNEPFLSRVINRFPGTFGRDYRNRLRECVDLLYTEEKLFPIIDGWVELVEDIARADRDRWDEGDYASLRQRADELQAFLRGRMATVAAMAADSAIPDRPEIEGPQTGDVLGPDQLTFVSSAFSDAPGDTHTASEWIATRVSHFSSESQLETVELIPAASRWRYRKGTSEPSGAALAWTQVDYDDSSWQEGVTSIGYGDGDDATELPDMQNTYSTVYLRREFEVADATEVGALELGVDYDDGFVAYLNGFPVLRANAPGGDPVPFDALAPAGHEAGTITVSRLDTEALSRLRTGTNVLAFHGLNTTLGSSDFSLDPSLRAILGDPDIVQPDVPLETLIAENELEPDGRLLQESGEKTMADVAPDLLPWQEGDILRVRVRHRDQTGRWSHWSRPVEVQITLSDLGPRFLRGDVNGDGRVDVGDPVRSLLALFRGVERVGCDRAADANADDLIDVSDAVFLLSYLFRSAAAPPAPFPDCNRDLTGSALGCEQHTACE